MELYRWQKECIDKWFENQTHGIVNVITGAGKTMMALTAADVLQNQLNHNLHIRIVVPTIELVRQWHKAIKEMNGEIDTTEETVSCFYGSHKSNFDREIVIYTINTARDVVHRIKIK